MSSPSPAAPFVPPQRSLFDADDPPPAAPPRAATPSTDAALNAMLGAQRNRAIVAECRRAMRELDEKRHRIYHAKIGVSGDDATLWLRAHAPDVDPRILGAVFRKNSGWEFLRWEDTKLEGRHKRPIRVWTWGSTRAHD